MHIDDDSSFQPAVDLSTLSAGFQSKKKKVHFSLKVICDSTRYNKLQFPAHTVIDVVFHRFAFVGDIDVNTKEREKK